MTSEGAAETEGEGADHVPTFAKVHALSAEEIRGLSARGIEWLAFPSMGIFALVHMEGAESQLSGVVDLQPDAVLEGYAAGCFPYPDQQLPGPTLNEPTTYFWHRPDPRTVFLLDQPRLQPELHRSLRTHEVTVNQAFGHCVSACATMHRTATRDHHTSKPWINNDLVAAYLELHQRNAAFSIETRDRSSGGILGGLIGVRIGHYVTVESMFRKPHGTSKPAFAALLAIARQESVPFIDVQLAAPHWTRWGAVAVSNTEFQSLLRPAIQAPPLNLEGR